MHAEPTPEADESVTEAIRERMERRVGRVRQRARRMPIVWLVALGLVVLVALITVGWLFANWEVNAAVMALPALVPLTIVLAAVAWLDRWEPEPTLLLALTAAYGAGAAIFGTLMTGNFLLEVANTYFADTLQQETFEILVQGPVVEEAVKAFGVILIMVIARRELDGPLDGFIYAAMIGAGFAFTENIIYFASSTATGGEFAWLLVVRCILSPFAHVLFTGAFGLAVGWAARRRLWWRYFAAAGVGLALAIGLHALWNGGSVLVLPVLGLEPTSPFAWIAYYLIIQVPLFGVVVWMLMHLQDHDVDVLRRRLDEYRRAGWFTRGEVRMITDWDARRAALRWAKRQPRDIETAMRGFIQDATRLAFAREHAAIDKRDPLRRPIEQGLLEATRRHREVLNSAQRATQRDGAVST